MGDPRKPKKKYSRPTHPWEKDRIEHEKDLKKEFGLKNKEEIWKAASMVRNYAKQAKKLVTLDTPQAATEKDNLIKRLQRLGLLGEGSGLDDVLSLTIRDILERRLQTQVYRANLARSVNQARQMITHGHIMVGKNKVTIPNYLVAKQEETDISINPKSGFFDQEHPERVKVKPMAQETTKKEKEDGEGTED